VAAVVDFGSSFSIKVTTQSSSRVGYIISPQISVSSTSPAVMGFLEEFTENHGFHPQFRGDKNSDSIRMEVTKRADVEQLLRLVEPYIIARREATVIMLDDLLPGLNEGKHSSEEGFVELMGYVDQIRDATTRRADPKYTQDYFRDEFGY
jgi:hypothetical protein